MANRSGERGRQSRRMLAIDGDGIVGGFHDSHFGNSQAGSSSAGKNSLDDATHTGPACSGGSGIDLADVSLRQVVLTRER